jgi:hypothetical protein
MENTNDEQEHTAKDDDFCSGLNGRRVTIEKSGYSIVDFGEDVISLFAIVIIVFSHTGPSLFMPIIACIYAKCYTSHYILGEQEPFYLSGDNKKAVTPKGNG